MRWRRRGQRSAGDKTVTYNFPVGSSARPGLADRDFGLAELDPPNCGKKRFFIP